MPLANTKGLPLAEEQRFRAYNAAVEGGLVVSNRVPGGPGASFLEAGDILLRMNGEPVCLLFCLRSLSFSVI